jgi:hypothetical protein
LARSLFFGAQLVFFGVQFFWRAAYLTCSLLGQLIWYVTAWKAATPTANEL